MPSSTSPNMGLFLPVPGTTTGPQWASETTANSSTIDTHDHTAGKGVQIPISALTVNADFSWLTFGQTNIGYASFVDKLLTANLTVNASIGNVLGQPYWRDSAGVVKKFQLAGDAITISNGSAVLGSLLFTNMVAPGTPAAGFSSVYVDSTSKNLSVKDDAGVVKHGVQAKAAVGSQWLTSISDAGVVTSAQPAFTDLSGSIAIGQIAANLITNAKLAQMFAASVKGRALGAGTGDPTDLTGAQVNLLLPVFTSALNGLVPLSGGGTTNFLRADGTFAAPGGGGGITALTGDVTATGPGSAAATVVNLPTGVTAAGNLLFTAIAAPGTPAGGTSRVYVDSTSKNLANKTDAGVVNHGIQTRTATANQWIRSIADDGSTTISQPAFSDISGQSTFAQFVNGAALSVTGRSANSAGVQADISATAATGAVLRESGSVIGWGTIATAGVANNAITNAKLAQMATRTVKMNATAGTADPSDVATATAFDALHDPIATIASAATTDLATTAAETVTVSGTVTITALGTMASGVIRRLHFSGALTLTHNATSLILRNAANLVTVAGNIVTMVSLGAGNWRQVGDLIAGRRFLGQQILTSGTTYTKTAGTSSCIVEGWGGGGAGGGAAATAAATVSVGGGGGSGGYFRKRVVALAAGPFTVAIGAGGTGVSGGTGNTGGITTFNDGTTTFTALGGVGGVATAAVASPTAAQGGQRAAVSTNADVGGFGQPGAFGLVLSAATGIGGGGANTSLGGGGIGSGGTAAGSAAGANTGSGGGGAMGNNSAALAGGAGGSGLIIVWEFS